MIVLIDNYDSFVHNLARYLRLLGQQTVVLRNDQTDVASLERLAPRAIVLSPGPCTPKEAGCSLDVVRHFHTRLPLLGVCLGHQTIAAALGGRVVRAARPMHGQASFIQHHGSGCFFDLPTPMSVGRYHSLVVDTHQLPEILRVDARLEDGTIMAISHQHYPVFGWQFHPESVLTSHGKRLLGNFLALAGLVETDRAEADTGEPSQLDGRDWFGRSIDHPTIP